MQVPAFASPGNEASKAVGASTSYFPLIRTFAYSLLASSLFSLFATLGLSFLSSLMLLSVACVLLCARQEQLDYEVQSIHAAGGSAGTGTFFCPQRGSVAHRKLNSVHGLALAAIIFGCLEAIFSISLFTAVGIPWTGRFSNTVLSTQQPFFSRTACLPSGGGCWGGVRKLSRVGRRMPPLPYQPSPQQHNITILISGALSPPHLLAAW